MPDFTHCATSCKEGGHTSYGQCLRSKRLSVTGLESTNPSFTREASKAWDSELDLYASARRQGVQPASTKREHVEAAIEVSQQLQSPFDASAPPSVSVEQ
jgi:phosphoglucomutase